MSNILLVNICLLAAVAAVCSNSTSSQPGDRQRREAPIQVDDFGRGPPWNMCCKLENPPDMALYKEKYAPMFKECKEGENGPKTFEVVMDCVAKKKKLVDDAGKLNEGNLKTGIKEFELQDYQKKIVDASITACVAKINGSGGGHGSPFQKFTRCLLADFMKVCPKEKQENSENCARIREGKN